MGMTEAAAAAGTAPRWRRPNGWVLGTLLIGALVAVPILSVAVLAIVPSGDLWLHLATTVLPGYVYNTLLLAFCVGMGTLVLGTGTAWLVTMCRFPGRRMFQWALLLPLAFPSYILAYTYTDLLDYAGPVQASLRALFGWRSMQDYWFPPVRTLGGAAVFMTLVLYPYVYLLARAAFMEQSTGVLEASRSLGHGPWRTFFGVSLPMARPGISIGVSLAVMETLNDFGTVDFFAVPTFSVGIYRTWLGMGNAPAAAQLALLLLVFVILVVWWERAARRGQRYHHHDSPLEPLAGTRLQGWRAALAALVCALPVVLGFLVPGAVLVEYSLGTTVETLGGRFLGIAANTLLVAVLAALVCVAAALFMCYGVRLGRRRSLRTGARLVSAGYAVPGAVLALGVIIPLAWLDNRLDGLMRAWFGVSTGLILSGTVLALVYAYSVRFLALPFGTLESALGKITRSMDHAAQSLGKGPGETLARIHLPMLRGSMLTAGVLVFVDAMKELPMTLVLRPFNFDTLATHVYQFASDELLEQAAPAAIGIVLTGLLPVLLLSRAITRTRADAVELPGGLT